MRIEVTAEDIAAANEWRKERGARIAKEGLGAFVHLGGAGDITRNCPVARAARRVFPDLSFVGATQIHVKASVYEMPRFAQDAINDWDIRDESGMEPFSFEVPDAKQ